MTENAESDQIRIGVQQRKEKRFAPKHENIVEFYTMSRLTMRSHLKTYYKIGKQGTLSEFPHAFNADLRVAISHRNVGQETRSVGAGRPRRRTYCSPGCFKGHFHLRHVCVFARKVKSVVRKSFFWRGETSRKNLRHLYGSVIFKCTTSRLTLCFSNFCFTFREFLPVSKCLAGLWWKCRLKKCHF